MMLTVQIQDTINGIYNILSSFFGLLHDIQVNVGLFEVSLDSLIVAAFVLVLIFEGISSLSV